MCSCCDAQYVVQSTELYKVYNAGAWGGFQNLSLMISTHLAWCLHRFLIVKAQSSKSSQQWEGPSWHCEISRSIVDSSTGKLGNCSLRIGGLMVCSRATLWGDSVSGTTNKQHSIMGTQYRPRHWSQHSTPPDNGTTFTINSDNANIQIYNVNVLTTIYGSYHILHVQQVGLWYQQWQCSGQKKYYTQ